MTREEADRRIASSTSTTSPLSPPQSLPLPLPSVSSRSRSSFDAWLSSPRPQLLVFPMRHCFPSHFVFSLHLKGCQPPSPLDISHAFHCCSFSVKREYKMCHCF